MLQLSGKVCCAYKDDSKCTICSKKPLQLTHNKAKGRHDFDFWRPFLATHTQNQGNAVLPDYNKNPTTRKFKKEVLSV